jgi:hypothetical protein
MTKGENSTQLADLTIVLRAEAKSFGLTRYFTGKPCKHGHVCERYTSDGICVECKAQRQIEWAKTNSAHVAERLREWARNNPDRVTASHNKYKKDNPSKVAAAIASWRSRNADHVAAVNSAWVRNNLSVVYANGHTYRARKRGVPGRHTAAETMALLESQGFICAASHCNADLRTIKKHLDHKNPTSRPDVNPTNSIDNLQWLCHSCNESKGNSTMLEWAARLAKRN